MARKDDRRIQKTRKQLRDSMLELILDQGYDDISIQDVTDRANLGRATFYLHYREKDELYADVMRHMAEEYFSSLPKHDPKKVQLFNFQDLKQLFNFVENHYDFYRIIIMGRAAMLTFMLLTDIAKNYILDVSKAQELCIEDATGVPSDFLVNYNAGTLISTIFWWLENNMPYTAEEMARMYEKMSFYANFQLLRDSKALERAEFDALRKKINEETQAAADSLSNVLADADNLNPETSVSKQESAESTVNEPTHDETVDVDQGA